MQSQKDVISKNCQTINLKQTKTSEFKTEKDTKTGITLIQQPIELNFLDHTRNRKFLLC